MLIIVAQKSWFVKRFTAIIFIIGVVRKFKLNIKKPITLTLGKEKIELLLVYILYFSYNMTLLNNVESVELLKTQPFLFPMRQP